MRATTQRHPIRGLFAGLFLGLGAAILLVIYGKIAFGTFTPYVVILVGIAVGVAWAMLARAGRTPRARPTTEPVGTAPAPAAPAPTAPEPPAPEPPAPEPITTEPAPPEPTSGDAASITDGSTDAATTARDEPPAAPDSAG